MVADMLRSLGEYDIVGLVERDDSGMEEAHGLQVIGSDGDLPRFREEGISCAAIGIGSVGDNRLRQSSFERLGRANFSLPTLVHPQAWISSGAHLGAATQVMAGALIQGQSELGDNVLINTGAIVEHGCRIGDHVHLATGARLGGDVSIEPGAFVGLGATIRQGVKIGRQAMVAAGSVVVDDVSEDARVAGVPARPMATTKRRA